MTGSLIAWDVASTALESKGDSGDCYLVKPFPEGVLVAVLDGLGHGSEAATVAKIAAEVLQAHAQENVITLLKRCHEALRGTRGAVISVASFNARDGIMTWVGIGNVEGLLLRFDRNVKPNKESLLLRRGLLGDHLPALHASIVPLMVGDTLIFTTDGIHNGFEQRINLDNSPRQIAANILRHYSKGNDDALVLVGRYVGQKR
jgi:serine phosphatase RsbU (regulator of sigma subunit)